MRCALGFAISSTTTADGQHSGGGSPRGCLRLGARSRYHADVPKLSQGRFVGRKRGDVGPRGLLIPAWEEIPNLSLDDLYAVAEHYEAELAHEQPNDHPAWLQKRAERVRTLIRQKERALEHRERQR